MDPPDEKPDRDYDSEPEREVGKILNDIIGWAAWRHHDEIAGIEVDFHALDRGIIIEHDGSYWHGHPKYWGDMDDRQKENFRRDARQEHILEEEHGFHVVRIWEDTVNKKPEELRERLKALLLDGDIPDGRYLIEDE